MGVGGGLGLRSSKGKMGRLCSRIVSASVSRFWEGDVVCSVSRGGTRSIGVGAKSREVVDCEVGVGEVGGGTGNSPRVIIRGVLTGDDVSISVLLSSGPAVAGWVTWRNNSREERYASIPIDAFSGVDGGLFALVDIALEVG